MKLVILIGTLVALAGCGDDKTSTPKTPATGPLVVYERGGGIASQPLKLTVDRSGHAALEVRTGPKLSHDEFTVGAGDLADLENAIDAAQGVDPKPTNTGCADCYEYSVKADGVAFHLDSVTYTDDATPAELKDLVAELDGLAGN
jgi:hypothetical protein